MALQYRLNPKMREIDIEMLEDLDEYDPQPAVPHPFVDENLAFKAPPSVASAMSSSPPRSSRTGREPRKASITPRRFKKFFAPRNGPSTRPSSRSALREIDDPFVNDQEASPSRGSRRPGILDSSPPPEFPRQLKRRKVFHTPETTPDQKELGFVGRNIGEDGSENEDVEEALVSSPCQRASSASLDSIAEEVEPIPYKPILPLRRRGLAGQLLERAHGSAAWRFGREHHVYPVNDWQDHTAKFYTKPSDTHITMSMENPNERTIPFCATSCNTNSLTAVGDEEGRVRLLETAEDGIKRFKDIYLDFRVHQNAIIDMKFSDDDTRLATASGDQSARVVDMATQTTTSILGHHTASLKQVRFQPSSNDVLATSSRDGSIQIWDLRCKGYDEPLLQIYAPVESGRPLTRSLRRKIQYGKVINSIDGAHKPPSRQIPLGGAPETLSSGENIGRLGDVSVTAIQFLPQGRHHLLLSASEADSSIKLWDIRCLPKKGKQQQALSSTQQPENHNKWRRFGISSLNMSGDSSRFYALSKDNTVYAYSTEHLILGQAPELALNNPRPSQRSAEDGLGPMYGFRHPQLHATSFYVKSALREAKAGKCEMLAVGSSDGCAILFPTDERYLPASQSQAEPAATLPRPTLRRSGSSMRRMEDDIPISMNGTALIRGHDREVGNLTWTDNGELITVGDDFMVRCWREGDGNGKEARDLRVKGEGEGRRWRCGWADVGEGFDDEEE